MILRLLFCWAVILVTSCTTGPPRFGKAVFELPPSYSRVHSPGGFMALDRTSTGPGMFMVQRARHQQDLDKLTARDWDQAGDLAMKTAASRLDFKNVRELHRSRGRHSGLRTMDHVLAGDLASFGGGMTEVVISSRLYFAPDEVYFFALANTQGTYSRDPGLFGRLMEAVRFE